MFAWLLLAASLSAVAFVTCCCSSCSVVQAITSWGANSTTIGHGATEQNGNWEILSGKLRVATADAIITWDAGMSEWCFYFDVAAMWNTWQIPTYPAAGWENDYTKELRFIWNYVDNSNYDYCLLRYVGNRIGPFGGSTWKDYLVSFGSRSGGVDTIDNPTTLTRRRRIST